MHERYAHLAAVSVAGQRQRAAAGHVLEMSGRVHENDRVGIGLHPLQCLVQMRMARRGIIQSYHPNISSHWPGFIDQEVDPGRGIKAALVFHRMPVLPVPPHYPHSQRRVQLPQQLVDRFVVG